MSINNVMRKISLVLSTEYFWVIKLPAVCRYLTDTYGDFEIEFDFSAEAHLWIGRNKAHQPVHLFEWLHHSLDYGNIPHTRATLKSGNTKIKQCYEDWHKTLPIGYHRMKEVGYSNLWGTTVRHSHKDISGYIKYDINLPHKEKIFTFFNGNPRFHRLITFMYMDDMDLLEKSFATMLGDGPHNDIFRQFKRELDLSRFPMKLHPNDADKKGLVTHTMNVPDTFVQAHVRSYFDFITETTIGNLGELSNNEFDQYGNVKDTYSGPDWWETEFFTEKLWRAIFYKRPFILLGSYKQTQTLRDMGFKTFNDFWDEDFDNEKDFMKRIMRVCLQVYNICKLDRQVIHNMFMSDSMKQIVEHNRLRFIEIQQNGEFAFPKPDLRSFGFTSESTWYLSSKDFAHINVGNLVNDSFKGSMTGILKKDLNIISPWV
jgi:hypothetical protein